MIVKLLQGAKLGPEMQGRRGNVRRDLPLTDYLNRRLNRILRGADFTTSVMDATGAELMPERLNEIVAGTLQSRLLTDLHPPEV